MPPTLAAKLRRAIERSGLRRTDVARRANVPQSRITDWCNDQSGRRPTLDQAGRLARVLHVSLEWLANPEAGIEPPPSSFTEAERILITAFRRTGLAPDEAVRWLGLGRDARNRPIGDGGSDLSARPDPGLPRKHA